MKILRNSGKERLSTGFDRLTLSGAKAKSFVPQVRTMEVSVPEGMMKVVGAIERAQH
jgi:hypothetical protein